LFVVHFLSFLLSRQNESWVILWRREFQRTLGMYLEIR
jgi:hypothetical protein